MLFAMEPPKGDNRFVATMSKKILPTPSQKSYDFTSFTMTMNESNGSSNEIRKQRNEQQENEQSNRARDPSNPSRLQVTHQGDQPNDETVNLTKGRKAKGLTHSRRQFDLFQFGIIRWWVISLFRNLVKGSSR